MQIGVRAVCIVDWRKPEEGWKVLGEKAPKEPPAKRRGGYGSGTSERGPARDLVGDSGVLSVQAHTWFSAAWLGVRHVFSRQMPLSCSVGWPIQVNMQMFSFPKMTQSLAGCSNVVISTARPPHRNAYRTNRREPCKHKPYGRQIPLCKIPF